MDKRTFRSHVFKLLFQIEFQSEDAVKESVENYALSNEISDLDSSAISIRLCDILGRREQIDKLIAGYSNGWNIDRIGKAELAILRQSIYEIVYDKDTPDAVAINEAVELAKLYADEKAAKFINGILGQVMDKKEKVKAKKIAAAKKAEAEKKAKSKEE